MPPQVIELKVTTTPPSRQFQSSHSRMLGVPHKSKRTHWRPPNALRLWRDSTLGATLLTLAIVCLWSSGCATTKVAGNGRAVYAFEVDHKQLGPIFIYSKTDEDCKFLHAILSAWEGAGQSYVLPAYIGITVHSSCYAARLKNGGQLWAGEAAAWGMASMSLEVCEGLLSGRGRLFQSPPATQCFTATLTAGE